MKIKTVGIISAVSALGYGAYITHEVHVEEKRRDRDRLTVSCYDTAILSREYSEITEALNGVFVDRLPAQDIPVRLFEHCKPHTKCANLIYDSLRPLQTELLLDILKMRAEDRELFGTEYLRGLVAQACPDTKMTDTFKEEIARCERATETWEKPSTAYFHCITPWMEEIGDIRREYHEKYPACLETQKKISEREEQYNRRLSRYTLEAIRAIERDSNTSRS